MFKNNDYELEVDFESNNGFVRVQGPHFDDYYCSSDRLKIYVPSKLTTVSGYQPPVGIEIYLHN